MCLKSLLMIIFCLLFYNSLSAQTIRVQASNSPSKSELYNIEGENLIFVDSLTSENETLSYTNKNLTNGLYRISFAQNKWLNFVFDGKYVEFITDYENILDSLKIVKSESNKLYYKFLKLNKDYKTKTELLNVILTHYPKDDEYYSITDLKLKSVQKDYSSFVNVESQENSKSFIARYIKSSQLPIIPQNIAQQEQMNFLKKHSLDNVNFDDAELISSDMFTNKSIEYLTYYRNPQLPKELLEQEFMKAVDTLLNKAKVNQLVYQHITEYLIDGFKKFGFDKIIDYILENYVIADDLCLEEELENSIQRRIDQSRLLSKGAIAPNFFIPNIKGKAIELNNISSERTLLVFFSTECPHCKELLPKLNELKKHNKKVEILAISLDSNEDDWRKYIDENKIDLININDPNSWDGDLANKYHIYATPTMFLLDNKKNILGKPTNFVELEYLLE